MNCQVTNLLYYIYPTIFGFNFLEKRQIELKMNGIVVRNNVLVIDYTNITLPDL